jgi:hypothetical protein
MKQLDDLLNDLSALEADLTEQLPKIVLEYAQNASALVIENIQHGNGIEGKKYSTEPMLATASMFLQKNKFKPDVIATTLGRDTAGKLIKGGARSGGKKIVNASGEVINGGNILKRQAKPRYRFIKFPNAKKAVPVMTLQGGYTELRSIQGLQVSKIDLTYSGRMFQNIHVIKASNESTYKVVAIIGGINTDTKKKLEGNYLRFGDFLAITPKIAEVVNQIPIDRVQEIIVKHLLVK